jgi:hypothetical protein
VAVEVERTTEALDQSDRAGSGRLVSVACFSDQMRGNLGPGRRHAGTLDKYPDAFEYLQLPGGQWSIHGRGLQRVRAQ